MLIYVLVYVNSMLKFVCSLHSLYNNNLCKRGKNKNSIFFSVEYKCCFHGHDLMVVMEALLMNVTRSVLLRLIRIKRNREFHSLATGRE